MQQDLRFGLALGRLEVLRISDWAVKYCKVASSGLSRLVAHLGAAHLRAFRLFIKGKFDAYVL